MYPVIPPIKQIIKVNIFKKKGKHKTGKKGKNIQFKFAPPEIAKINNPNILLNMMKLLSFKIFIEL